MSGYKPPDRGFAGGAGLAASALWRAPESNLLKDCIDLFVEFFARAAVHVPGRGQHKGSDF